LRRQTFICIFESKKEALSFLKKRGIIFSKLGTGFELVSEGLIVFSDW
jgi:hypothetical protein